MRRVCADAVRRNDLSDCSLQPLGFLGLRGKLRGLIVFAGVPLGFGLERPIFPDDWARIRPIPGEPERDFQIPLTKPDVNIVRFWNQDMAVVSPVKHH